MKARRIAKASLGFTLVELVTAIAIAAILMAIAAPGFVAFQRGAELSAAVNSLVAAIATARGEAIKHGMPAVVVPADGTDWRSGWVVFIDRNANQAFDESTDALVLRQPALPSRFNVLPSPKSTAAAKPPYLQFNALGYPVNDTGGFGGATLSIYPIDLQGPPALAQTRNVIIHTFGRVRSCQPASANDATCSVPTPTSS